MELNGGKPKCCKRQGFEAKSAFRCSETFIFLIRLKIVCFFFFWCLLLGRAVQSHAGTCRHVDVYVFNGRFTSLALFFEDTLCPKKTFRSKNRGLYFVYGEDVHWLHVCGTSNLWIGMVLKKAHQQCINMCPSIEHGSPSCQQIQLRFKDFKEGQHPIPNHVSNFTLAFHPRTPAQHVAEHRPSMGHVRNFKERYHLHPTQSGTRQQKQRYIVVNDRGVVYGLNLSGFLKIGNLCTVFVRCLFQDAKLQQEKWWYLPYSTAFSVEFPV